MHRRKLLGALGAGLSGLAGCITKAKSDTDTDAEANANQQTTTRTLWCTDYEHDDRDYPCHNHDNTGPNEGLDTYYIKAWAGDAEYEYEEDMTNDLDMVYRPYFYYNSLGVEGTVTNLLGHDIPNVYAEAAFYADDTNQSYVVGGESYIGTLKSGLKYTYDVPLYTNYAGQYSVFEFWIRQM